MNELTVLLGIAAIALLIGGGLGYWLADRRARLQAAKAEDVQQRFDDYRQQVTAHFGRTAEHFQAIGEQYRELYEHMASGAETLFDAPEPVGKLDMAPRDRIGVNEAEAVDVDATGDAKVAEVEAAPERREAEETSDLAAEDADTVSGAEPPDDGSRRTYH